MPTSGFFFTITGQPATIILPILDDGEAEGTESLTFTRQVGEGYTIDPNTNSSTITIEEQITTMPTVSFQTIAGTFDEDDNILAPALVRSPEDGASLITFVFSVDEEIPEGGLVVDVNSNIDLTDYFTGLARPPFGAGGQILEAIYDPETGEATGFRFRIDQQNAQVALRLINEEAASGIVDATFTLEPGEAYDIDPDASSSGVTIYDTLANVPPATIVPEVSFSISETSLVESEGTATTISFTLSEAPPEGGVLVSVGALAQFLGDFNIFAAQVEGGVLPAPNFQSSGFFFKILEQEASITIPVFPDGVTEGTESITLSLQEAPGYTIASGSEPITVTITDTPESEIQVSFTTEPSTLIESEATVSVHTFSLSTPPPDGGITVFVSTSSLGEFNLEGVAPEGGDITEVTDTGFFFNITAQEATISLPVANDGEAEGLEEATFTLEAGEGYQVDPDASSGTFNIVDTPDQVPPSTEVSEPNDTIELAVDTQLSELNPTFSISSSINYDNANRYEVEGGFLYVDATEDVDLYKVELKAGDTIKIDLDSNQFGEGRKVDTWLRVFDVAGAELASNDDGAAPDEVFEAEFQSYIEFTASADGEYYIGVSLYGNGEYDPNQPASGTGDSDPAIPAIDEYGPGEYTLNISLNNPDAFIAEPTEIPSGTGEGPAISLFTVAGTYGNDFDNLGFDIIAPGIAETVPEDAGAALNFVLVANGEIPEGGVEVYISSNIALTDYFGGIGEEDYTVAYGGNLNGKPFSRGGEFLNAVYDEDGNAVGFKFLLEDPFATIVLNPTNREEAETNGPETVTFSVVESAGYTVSPQSSSSVTFYDTIEQVPTPTTSPEVSLEFSTTELIESEETAFTLTLSLSEPPPPEGVQVYVSGNAQDFLNEFAIFDAQFTGGVPVSDGAVSGFYFLMLAQTATITLPVFNSVDVTEGIEQFNVSLVPGAGYTVNPDQSSAVLTIKDTADSQIQVSFSTEPEVLIESEATESVHTFSLSAAPPEGGVTVSVSAPNLGEFNLDAIEVTGGTIAAVREDGFDLTITAQTATINLPVAADDEDEGVEEATFTLEAGEGYQVNPDANTGTFTIADTPEVAPSSPEEVNDTIGTAIATGLSADNTSVSFEGEISQYFVEDDEGNELTVDASEDIDFYSFTLKADDTVKIDVDSIEYQLEGFNVPQRLDSELRLFNAAGVELASNFDGFAPDELFVANRDPYLEFTATEAGTYYVGVAQWQNRVYDPLTGENSSGRVNAAQGRNTGEYTLDINLEPGDGGGTDGPVVSLTATPELVEEGSEVTFNFDVTGDFPAEGLLIKTNEFFNSQFDFNFEFEDPTKLNGIEFVDYEETETDAIITWRLTQPNAFIKVDAFDDNIVEADEVFTLELLPNGDDYTVNPDADDATVTISDEDVTDPNAPYGPVSLSVDKTNLNEGDTFTITINVEGEIPEGGLEVNIDSETFASLGEFAIFDAAGNFLPEYTGIEGNPAANEDASGFSVFVSENTATITIEVFDDGANEGVEDLTFSVLDGENYDVDPDESEVTLTIDDGDEGEFFGGSGIDVFDSELSPEFNGSNDFVFAGGGNDLIDTSAGNGNNRLYGQGGDDTFFLGSNDRAFGNGGNDRFYTLGGGNVLTGGTGADQFWLVEDEIPETSNTITDFNLAEGDVIGIGGLDLTFTDLTLTQQNGNTLIASGEQELAKLLGVNSSLSADNFVFG